MAKALGLNQRFWFGFGIEGSPTRFARQSVRLLGPSVCAAPVTVTLQGSPPWNDRMSVSCHPPNIVLSTPPRFISGLPFPNGSSYTALVTNRCRTSNPELDRLALKSVVCWMSPADPPNNSARLSIEWLHV